MFCKINSCSLFGISGSPCLVEVDTSNGIPSINIVGNISASVKEIRSRAIIAIKNSGYKYIPKKITINISPATTPKHGTSMELAICLGIIHNLGHINRHIKEDTFFLGEVGLNGNIKRVNGILPMLIAAKKAGCKICFIPYENLAESNLIKDISIIGVKNICEVVDSINSKNFSTKKLSANLHNNAYNYPLFENINSQDINIRNALISASGMHNMILSGPNGIGKTLISNAIIGILPDMSQKEILELNAIYSSYGKLNNSHPIISRPFRNPLPSISINNLLGGGYKYRCGEISFAHNGILFIDEINYMKNDVLNSLRIPLENKYIKHFIYGNSYILPSNFLFIGALNSCPCGNFPDLTRCSCTADKIKKYRSKLNSPFLDRIDLFINMQKINSNHNSSYTTKKLKEVVINSRNIQIERNNGLLNSELSFQDIKDKSNISSFTLIKIEDLLSKMNISFRGYTRVFRLARTIADIENSSSIKDIHIEEALFLERNRTW